VKRIFPWILVIVMALLGINGFAFEIEVQEFDSVLALKIRTLELEFDTQKGVITSIHTVVDRQRTHIFEYADDGFDILDADRNELLPLSYEYREDPIDDTIVITFTYESGSKTFVVPGNPYYEFSVVVDFAEPVIVNLPFISFEDRTTRRDGFFVSYNRLNRQKTVVAIASENGTFQTYQRFLPQVSLPAGRNTLGVFAGPLRLVYLSEALPDQYTEIRQALNDFGALNFFSYIFHGLVVFLYWLFQLTGNFGWAIILFTIVVRLLLLPLNNKQTKSMLDMQAINPEIQKIRKKYKDPRKQQEALGQLYKERGVSPATGCLTMLIQLPVFIILYNVIRYFGEMFAYSPRFLIWTDLSTGGFTQNILLVAISISTSVYLATLRSQDAKGARQQMLMGSIFPFIFITFPTGLLLYWTTNSLLELPVTFLVYKRRGVKGVSFRDVFGLPPKPVK